MSVVALWSPNWSFDAETSLFHKWQYCVSNKHEVINTKKNVNTVIRLDGKITPEYIFKKRDGVEMGCTDTTQVRGR